MDGLDDFFEGLAKIFRFIFSWERSAFILRLNKIRLKINFIININN